MCHATTVNALVENVKSTVFNPDNLILYFRGSGKASFQQTGWLRPQLKTGLFPLLISFAPFFTVLSENTSLPVLTLLTFHFPHGLTADSSEHHPTIQTVRQGHSLLQQHRCPATHHRLLCSFDRAALQYKDPHCRLCGCAAVAVLPMAMGKQALGWQCRVLGSWVIPPRLCSPTSCNACPASQRYGCLLRSPPSARAKPKCSSNELYVQYCPPRVQSCTWQSQQ